MGSGKAMRLELGVEIEKRVLAKSGTRDDIALVCEERPDLIASFADQIIETAGHLRSDKESFRLTDPEIVIQIPALPRPTLAELQEKYSWICSIEQDDSPIEAVTLRLATMLKSTEHSINGPTYEWRLAPLRGRVLGYQQWQWVLANQEQFPALMVLLGKIYIDFSGIIVVNSDSDRGFPYADQDGERWGEDWDWIGGVLNEDGRLAISSK